MHVSLRLSEVIREQMTKRRLTAKQVAKLAKTTERTVMRVRAGHHVKLELADRLLKAVHGRLTLPE